MTNNVVNLVQRDGQKAFTTSLIVAEIFGKRHADVLRDIRARTEYENSEVQKFNQRNFALVEYLDAKGESRPMYRLTHDGFAEIAMSYNATLLMLRGLISMNTTSYARKAPMVLSCITLRRVNLKR